ncbi:MAG: hypothetical protein KIT31_21155 [Deltaproteobacteria bacterium]|nr:hypothetical protein [Deltaproteobacteria bacterium]
MEASIFLSGEGPNELGSRYSDPADGTVPGVLEVLLRRVRPTGWKTRGAMAWKAIRKYRAGAGRLGAHHDRHNVQGLVAHAYAEHAEVLAFMRDLDGDPDRAAAIDDGLAEIRGLFEAEYRYALAIIAGTPAPCLEGWIIAMCGVRGTDAMSRAKVMDALTERGLELKRLAAYLPVVEAGDLDRVEAPTMVEFLATAREVLADVIDGT